MADNVYTFTAFGAFEDDVHVLKLEPNYGAWTVDDEDVLDRDDRIYLTSGDGRVSETFGLGTAKFLVRALNEIIAEIESGPEKGETDWGTSDLDVGLPNVPEADFGERIRQEVERQLAERDTQRPTVLPMSPYQPYWAVPGVYPPFRQEQIIVTSDGTIAVN